MEQEPSAALSPLIAPRLHRAKREQWTMNNNVPKGMCHLCSLRGPTEPWGAPAFQEQQENHWEGIIMGWSMVGAALPAWIWTSALHGSHRSEDRAWFGNEQESRAVGAVAGQAGGGARLWEGKIQTGGVL